MKAHDQQSRWQRLLAVVGVVMLLGASQSGCHQVHQARAQKLANSALEHFAAKEFDQGLEHSEIALRLGSDNPNLRRARAMVFLERGDPTAALTEADAGLALIGKINADPHHPYGTLGDEFLSEFQFIRGNSLQAVGRLQDARDSLADAVRFDEKNTGAQNNLAWLLATSPVDHVRDGKQAIVHATAACELTQWKAPGTLDTLAAAYAEAGDFDNALKWQAEAISQFSAVSAKQNGEDPDGYRIRLDLYRAGKPVREDPQVQFESKVEEADAAAPVGEPK